MNEKDMDPAASPAPDTQETNTAELAQLNLESAKASLAKLPILGPALWPYERDPLRKYQRLRAGGCLAPHEWKSGTHAWLIDMVTPFGADDAILIELRSTALAGHVVKTAVPDARQAGQVVIHEWPAQTSPSKDMSQGS